MYKGNESIFNAIMFRKYVKILSIYPCVKLMYLKSYNGVLKTK
jgi:hypothetical protein